VQQVNFRKFNGMANRWLLRKSNPKGLVFPERPATFNGYKALYIVPARLKYVSM
jgi:hypothetical protein